MLSLKLPHKTHFIVKIEQVKSFEMEIFLGDSDITEVLKVTKAVKRITNAISLKTRNLVVSRFRFCNYGFVPF